MTAYKGDVNGHSIDRLYVVSASFTRPADTTAYAANDVVSDSTSAPTAMQFTQLLSGDLVKARLFVNQSTNTAQFRLHLFHTAPTAINDNAAYTLLWANRANKIGWVDFPALSTEGSGSDAAQSLLVDIPLPMQVNAPGTVWGLLETKTAFTPASGSLWYVELTVRPY